MKLHYDRDTDSFYIDLADRPGMDSLEIVPGIDRDQASRWVNLPTTSESAVPFARGIGDHRRGLLPR